MSFYVLVCDLLSQRKQSSTQQVYGPTCSDRSHKLREHDNKKWNGSARCAFEAVEDARLRKKRASLDEKSIQFGILTYAEFSVSFFIILGEDDLFGDKHNETR